MQTSKAGNSLYQRAERNASCDLRGLESILGGETLLPHQQASLGVESKFSPLETDLVESEPTSNANALKILEDF